MKFLTSLILVATLTVFGDDAPVPPSSFGELKMLTSAQVRVDVLMVSVPVDEALKLLPGLRDSATVDAGQKAILELVAQKKAILNAWPELTAHDSEHSLTEGVIEKNYYNGPDDLPAPDSAAPAPNIPEAPLPAVPPATTVKNLGATVELGAVISKDGKSATLQVAPQRVTMLEMETVSFIKPDKGTVEVKRPLFGTQKVTSTITLRDGERRLILTDKSAAPNGYIDFFIVGLKIIPAEK